MNITQIYGSTDTWQLSNVKSASIVPKSSATLRPVLYIPGYLVLPFGRAVKSDLQKIVLSSVSPDGVYLSTDISVITICKAAQKPLCLGDFERQFGKLPSDVPYDDDVAILQYMCTTLKSHNPNMTSCEELFLDLYFGILTALHVDACDPNWVRLRDACERIGIDGVSIKRYKTPNDVWRALLPIPELQLYVRDPLAEARSSQPDINLRVDYGFWDGAQLHAVEIDGADPDGYARDIRRDRLLRNERVNLIHILNMELKAHEGRMLQKWLPPAFLGHGWNYEGERPFEIPF